MAPTVRPRSQRTKGSTLPAPAVHHAGYPSGTVPVSARVGGATGPIPATAERNRSAGQFGTVTPEAAGHRWAVTAVPDEGDVRDAPGGAQYEGLVVEVMFGVVGLSNEKCFIF